MGLADDCSGVKPSCQHTRQRFGIWGGGVGIVGYLATQPATQPATRLTTNITINMQWHVWAVQEGSTKRIRCNTS